MRCERQRRYVHGRPSAYKRTGGRKVYDFIGRVGRSAVSVAVRCADAAACIIIIIIVCVCVYTAVALTQSGIGTSGRRSPDHACITICIDTNTRILRARGPNYNKIIITMTIIHPSVLPNPSSVYNSITYVHPRVLCACTSLNNNIVRTARRY